MTTFITSLKAEISMLELSRAHAIGMAQDLLTREAGSEHLGYNLASRAAEITAVTAKLAQTRTILRSLEAEVARG